jgi:hypothetical protein
MEIMGGEATAHRLLAYVALTNLEEGKCSPRP